MRRLVLVLDEGPLAGVPQILGLDTEYAPHVSAPCFDKSAPVTFAYILGDNPISMALVQATDTMLLYVDERRLVPCNHGPATSFLDVLSDPADPPAV